MSDERESEVNRKSSTGLGEPVGQTLYKSILVLCGWGFFAYKDPMALVWLLGVTVLGYALGIEIGEGRFPRAVMAFGIVIFAGGLIFVKYGDLITGQRLIIPLGLSYYTLMVIGYMIDVQRGKISPEKNPVNFALFVGFLPQMTAGPIGRATDLLAQYRKKIRLTPHDIKAGVFMIILGVFEKYVLADNFSLVVDGIVKSDATGLALIAAILMYSFVIYYDFAGYSLIALGIGRLLGIRLADNFRGPFLATSIKEFWRRWHISLSTWFRDYLYIPMGGSKCSKLRRDFNTFVVFTVSGAWHGQALGYWAWGGIHGIYLVIENRFRSLFLKRRLKKDPDLDPDVIYESAIGNFFKRIAVFILVSIAWIPFYAQTPGDTLRLLKRMVSIDLSGFIARFKDGFGLRWQVWVVLGIGVLAYLVISCLREYFSYSLYERVADHGWIIIIVGIVFYAVLLMVAVYGSAYDETTFIYGGF